MRDRNRALVRFAFVIILVPALIIPILVMGYSPKLGLDLVGGTSVTLKAMGDVTGEQLDQAVEIIRNRIDRIGVAEPVITREGTDRIMVQLPDITDRDRALNLVGNPAQLQFRQVKEIYEPYMAEYDEVGLTDIESDDPEYFQELKKQEIVLPFEREGETIKIRLGPTEMTGDHIKEASANVDSQGKNFVQFELDGEGAKIFAELTTRLVAFPQGSDERLLAIVLDYDIKSYPNVNEAITDGRGVIEGDFSLQEIRDLVTVLKTGALPVEFERDPITETISPILGKESLEKGLIAGFVGLGLVAIYLLIMYRMLGLVSVLGLAIFGTLFYSIVVILGETIEWALTLAGLTGVIVSIGIAADSNIVYFERLKENIRDGKTMRSSAENAFKLALRTVIAGTFVTFAAAFILWILAIGPVKGFAFALGISTMLSVFIFYFYTHNAVTLLSGLGLLDRNSRLIGVGREVPGGEA